MTVLTNYPVSLCFCALFLLGVSLFLFSSFCVLIFIALCLDSVARKGVLLGEEKKLLLCMDQYQGECQIPYATCLIWWTSHRPPRGSYDCDLYRGGNCDSEKWSHLQHNERGDSNLHLSVWAKSLAFSIEQSLISYPKGLGPDVCWNSVGYRMGTWCISHILLNTPDGVWSSTL